MSSSPPVAGRVRARSCTNTYPGASNYTIVQVLAALVVVPALVLVGACSHDSHDSPESPTEPPAHDASPSSTDGEPAPAGDPTLADNMVRIEGAISTGRADAATDGDIAGPFTMQVPSRGGGNGAVFNPVATDGVAGSIVWDGGRPLTLDGPALHFDGSFTLDGGVTAFDLSRGAVALVPGTYSIVGPVAIGDSSGLARPADQVTFVAGPEAGILGTGASTVVLPGDIVLLGPGTLDLTGSFTITTSTGATIATSFHVADESFEITVSAANDGTLSVSGLARGAGWA